MKLVYKIIILLFLLYYITYFNQLGYYSYYGINKSFIEININNILTSIIPITTLSLIIFLIIYNVIYNFNKYIKINRKVLYIHLFISIILTFILLVFSILGYIRIHIYSIYDWVINISILLFFIYIILFVLVPIYKSNNNRYDENYTGNKIIAGIPILKICKYLVAINIITICILFSYFIGKFSAYSKKEYYITYDDPKEIIILRNNNYIILEEYDEKNEVLSKKYRIISLSEMDELKFEVKRIKIKNK